VSDSLVIQSHRGPYTVTFDDAPVTDLGVHLDGSHCIVDANVARLYQPALRAILDDPRTLVIEATERAKSIEQLIPVYERLVANAIRRDHTLVAIGGGIIQDICAFIASTLLRGVSWRFLPTTLLAQADSCIGSKSSINLGATKNILGTFRPPRDVVIHTEFLATLEPREIRSGIGEIIKVHAIDGIEAFDRLAADFGRLAVDRAVLLGYIQSALRIKQRFIEADEFDEGIRNIFNYGHSFGHAIESATRYEVPHGIAISIGMDMANYVAARRALISEANYARMHGVLSCNYGEYARTPIPVDAMLGALMKDKKNTTKMLGLILPVGESASIQRVQLPPDQDFRAQCAAYLSKLAA
jgi:3-dehydroquinate synthase